MSMRKGDWESICGRLIVTKAAQGLSPARFTFNASMPSKPLSSSLCGAALHVSLSLLTPCDGRPSDPNHRNCGIDKDEYLHLHAGFLRGRGSADRGEYCQAAGAAAAAQFLTRDYLRQGGTRPRVDCHSEAHCNAPAIPHLEPFKRSSIERDMMRSRGSCLVGCPRGRFQL
jgi:hypothetical protein